MRMADPDLEHLEGLLALAADEAKRVQRHARICTQLVARARDAAATANPQPQEAQQHGNRQQN